jgi:hypothetical protein
MEDSLPMSIAENGVGQGCSPALAGGAGTPTPQTVFPSDGQSHVVTTCDELPRPGISKLGGPRITEAKGVNLRFPDGWTGTASAQQNGAEVTIDIASVQPAPKPVKRCDIVGKAPSSLGLARYLDKDYSIWGLSDGWKNMPRPVNSNDVWFELHDIDTGRRERWPPEYYDWLKANQGVLPIYIGHRLRVDKYTVSPKYMTLEQAQQLDRDTKPPKDLPNVLMYPVYEVLWRWGTYFNNSISFMMAMAWLKSFTHVGLFGVDMAQSDPVTGQNGEYEHQRPSCEYMIGILRGSGIDVYVPGEADLLKCKKLYAFETHGNENEEEKKRIARVKELQAGIQKHRQQQEMSAQRIIALSGALDQMNYDYRRSR